MQSLWCCQQILTKSVAQVHVYLPEGTLTLREGTKVHINVLPLGVLLVCQFLEVGEEISFHLLLVEEVITLVDDSLEATAAYRLGSCRKVEVVLLFPPRKANAVRLFSWNKTLTFNKLAFFVLLK